MVHCATYHHRLAGRGTRSGFVAENFRMSDTQVYPISPFTAAHHKDLEPALNLLLQRAGEIVLGKPAVIRLAVTCLLAGGHLLIEDVPGVGKTTLAQCLAKLLGLSFQRIQFTSDLLPADILGVSIYERNSGEFCFHEGPLFAQLVLADEVNRATPKSQSALLEAMEEHQVTIDGECRKLPEPFFVIATQNPDRQIGTFPLPESQLDRFLMRLQLGYPDRDAERALYKGENRHRMIHNLEPCLLPETFQAAQQAVARVHVSEALLDYIQALVDDTRQAEDYELGLSPRAGLAILHAARAYALLQGRDHVLPEDVQAVLPAVASHRLKTRGEAVEGSGTTTPMGAGDDLVRRVPIP